MRRRTWRKNVLFLMTLGYVAILSVFFRVSFMGAGAAEAYGIIEPALMALTGGAIGMAKDILQSEQEDS